MIKQDNIIKSKDEILEFLDFYEKYCNLATGDRKLILGMVLGLQFGSSTEKEENASESES